MSTCRCWILDFVTICDVTNDPHRPRLIKSHFQWEDMSSLPMCVKTASWCQTLHHTSSNVCSSSVQLDPQESLKWRQLKLIVMDSKPANLYMHQCHRALSVLLRVSHPSQVVLPFPRWEPKEKPVKEDDVGPQVTHIYEVKVRNWGAVKSSAKCQKCVLRDDEMKVCCFGFVDAALYADGKDEEQKKRCGKL